MHFKKHKKQNQEIQQMASNDERSRQTITTLKSQLRNQEKNKRHQYERPQKPKPNHHSNPIQKPWGLRTLRSRMTRIQKQHMNPKEKGGANEY